MTKQSSCKSILGGAAALALMAQFPALSAVPVPGEQVGSVAPAVSDFDEPARVPEPDRAASPSDAAPGAQPPMQEGAREPKPAADGASKFDAAMGLELQALVSKRLDHFIARRQDRRGVAEFYENRGFAPLWIADGKPHARAKAAMDVLAAADSEGLDSAQYPVPDFTAAGVDPVLLAQAELRLTDAVLTYARHAQAGRFGAQRITTEIEVAQVLPEAADVLKHLAQASDPGAALAGYNPPHPEYRALKAKLAELRANLRTETRMRIDQGPLLRPGMKDARVPALRRRLDLPDDRRDLTYDNDLVDAVREFQRRAGLQPDGVIGPRTIHALNGGPSRADRTEAVIANMERWRWMPRDLGGTYVMVNIPDYSLKLVQDGKIVWSTRVVVGKPSTPTPIFSAEMENILLNPTWHVPESIIYNDYLPALQQDPTVLQRMGLILERARDGRIAVRQPPGPKNALGFMKFNFANRFHVYLHDTPAKELFSRTQRAYSAGCVRVENPARFGELLLSIAMPNENYSAERLKQGWGGPERWIRFSRKIPIHLVYMSAFVDGQGKLVVRDDVYGYDRRTIAAIKEGDRQAVSYAAPPSRPPAIDPAKRRALEYLVQETEYRSRPAFFFNRFFR